MFIPIEKAGEAKDKLQKISEEFAEKNNCVLADFRLEITNGLAADSLNGETRGATKNYSADIGTRVYWGKTTAGGFAGKSLGEKDFAKTGKILESLLSVSLKRAKANSAQKEKQVRKFGAYSRGIYSTRLSPVKAEQKEWAKKFEKNPLNANLEDFIERSKKISSEISQLKGITANGVAIFSALQKKVLGNSEGTLIEQTRAITEPSVYIAAKGKHEETFHDWIAEAHGLEALEGKNSHEMSIEEFAMHLATGTIELSNAKTAKPEKNCAIITDPWFNTLLSHEICGHPLEADRALKRETAWAGRAWWFRDLKTNKLGEKIGSEEMTVISNPELEGNGTYGTYLFDDEGVRAKKIVNIEKGTLKGFMNSRETASILDEEPNGHMRATSASMMPIIRMSNTYFGKGTWKKEELFAETKKGYYLVGLKTPSIGESRQNFNITSWKCYRIENGEIKELLRNAGLEANSQELFNTIKAADDVKYFNVPNCGKGTPMQTMRLGNGGPHLKSTGNLTGKRS